MTSGYDKPLYVLAFDHRTSFQTKLFGIEGEPTPEERARIREAKQIILDGLLAAAEAAPPGTVGALVDEEHGADVAREAKRRGLPLAMSAERSSVPELEFEYGDDFARHIEEFEPDFVKILARYNTEGWLAGDTDRATAVELIADNYRSTIELYEGAAAAV